MKPADHIGSLEVIHADDFPTIRSWIRDARFLTQYAGPQFTFPLSDDQLKDYITDPSKKVYKLVDSKGKMIGKCELNFQSESHIRLSRILISPEEQGKGWGQLIVCKMIEKAMTFHPDPMIDLWVFSFNGAAIHCYQKQGFQISAENTTWFKFENETWMRLNMTYTQGE